MSLSRVIIGVLSSHTRRSSQWLSVRRFPFAALQIAPFSADAPAPAKRTDRKVPKSKPLADSKSMPEADPPNLSPSPSAGVHEESLSLDVQRPKEIPFQIKVANQVHLIGSVGMPVKLQTLPDGSLAAISILTREEDRGLQKQWIPVIFLGDLAQIAASYLKENDVIYVTGQLSGDALSHIIEGATTDIQVLADSLSFVQNVYPGKVHHKIKEKVEPTSVAADNTEKVNSVEDAWNDLVLNPHNWWDYRTEKLNGSVKPKFPDFKHTRIGYEALWLDDAPNWVLPKLEELVFDTNKKMPTEQYNTKKMNSVEDAWNDLVLNPHNWRDYRTEKLNGSVKPKFPDFKHAKIESAALWLDRAPSWVLPKLDELVFDTNKKMPTEQCNSLRENLWKSLVDNPNDWWDNRLTKHYKAGPDFKHKESGENLWLSSAPEWVLEKLPPAKPWKNVQTFSSSATLLS